MDKNRALMLMVVLFGVGVTQAAILAVQDQTPNGDDLTVQDAGFRGGTYADTNWGIGTKPRITSSDNRGALLWFDLSSIPAGQTVVSATLDLRLRPPGGGAVENNLASLSRVKVAWGSDPMGLRPVYEGNGTPALALEGEPTWNNRIHPSLSWGAAGCLSPSDKDMSRVVNMWNPVDWQVLMDVTDIVKTWIEGGDPNYGFVLNDAATSVDGYYRVGLSEVPTVSQRPKLTVTYLNCGDPFADIDHDGDVDQVDFGFWQLCYTDNGGIAVGGCLCFDRNGDLDVDSSDFAAFEDCASGPSVPARTACDGGQ